MDVRVGLWRKLSAEEFMLLNYNVGEDSWESLGLQGDPTNPFWRKSALGFLWKEWCWSWNSNTLTTSCKELTYWKRLWLWEGLGAGGEGDDKGWDGWMHHWLDGHESEWTPGVGDGQGGLACYDSWGPKESDTTEQLNWTNEVLERDTSNTIFLSPVAFYFHDFAWCNNFWKWMCHVIVEQTVVVSGRGHDLSLKPHGSLLWFSFGDCQRLYAASSWATESLISTASTRWSQNLSGKALALHPGPTPKPSLDLGPIPNSLTDSSSTDQSSIHWTEVYLASSIPRGRLKCCTSFSEAAMSSHLSFVFSFQSKICSMLHVGPPYNSWKWWTPEFEGGRLPRWHNGNKST